MLKKVYSILVYDNEYLVAMDIERILSDVLGCDVQIATRHDLVELATSRSFDLAIVDSENLCSTVRAFIAAKTCSIILTAFDSDIRRSGISGFDSVPLVLKPFDESALVGVVSSMMENTAAPVPRALDSTHLENAWADEAVKAGSGP